MIHQKHVDFYINQYKNGEIKLNKDRIDLIEYLERDVLSRDDIYFDDKMIEDCINYGEKWFFPLEPFQKFLIAFVFLFFKKNDRNFYRKFLWFFGRGGGKNGLLSVVLNYC
jgi:phage terminase large subunit-like protein